MSKERSVAAVRTQQLIQPTHNKVLQKKWDDTIYKEHLNRVKQASSALDTRSPPKLPHVSVKLKKLQLEKEKKAQIDRENERTKRNLSLIRSSDPRLDNKNDRVARSLHQEKMERDKKWIAKENESHQQRVKNRRPEYENTKFKQDWQKTKKVMKNISLFPETAIGKQSIKKETTTHESLETGNNSTKEGAADHDAS